MWASHRLNDIGYPDLQSIFNLSYKQASLVQCLLFAYFIFAIPAAKMIDTTSYTNVHRDWAADMAAGAFRFHPAQRSLISVVSWRADGAGSGNHRAPGRRHSVVVFSAPQKQPQSLIHTQL